MNLTDYAENKIFDALLRGQSLGAPATLYIALGTNTYSDSGSPTEPSGNGYARVSLTANLTNFNGTDGTSSASSGTDGTGDNAVAITFPTSTGAWASGSNIQSVWIMDASTGGNAWIGIDLTSPFAVTAAGVTLSFPAGNLDFTIDN